MHMCWKHLDDFMSAQACDLIHEWINTWATSLIVTWMHAHMNELAHEHNTWLANQWMSTTIIVKLITGICATDIGVTMHQAWCLGQGYTKPFWINQKKAIHNCRTKTNWLSYHKWTNSSSSKTKTGWATTHEPRPWHPKQRPVEQPHINEDHGIQNKSWPDNHGIIKNKSWSNNHA